jgi:hypothetical protein
MYAISLGENRRGWKQIFRQVVAQKQAFSGAIGIANGKPGRED